MRSSSWQLSDSSESVKTVEQEFGAPGALASQSVGLS